MSLAEAQGETPRLERHSGNTLTSLQQRFLHCWLKNHHYAAPVCDRLCAFVITRGAINIVSSVLWVEMIISGAERLDMLLRGANRDTMERRLMDGSPGDDATNQWPS